MPLLLRKVCCSDKLAVLTFFFIFPLIDALFPSSGIVEGPSKYTRNEIQTFMEKFPWTKTTETSALIVLHDRVYDIRDFIDQHPGGAVILTYLGRDGTGTLRWVESVSWEANSKAVRTDFFQ
jgi:hypothetical protein